MFLKFYFIKMYFIVVGKGVSVFDYVLEEGIEWNILFEIDWLNNVCDSYNKYLDDVSLLR